MTEIRLHNSGGERIVAENVRVCDSPLAELRGQRFRRPLREGEAVVFQNGPLGVVDMLGVFEWLCVCWLNEETVTNVACLPPLVGIGRGDGDRVVELPGEARWMVSEGDRLEVRG